MSSTSNKYYNDLNMYSVYLKFQKSLCIQKCQGNNEIFYLFNFCIINIPCQTDINKHFKVIELYVINQITEVIQSKNLQSRP